VIGMIAAVAPDGLIGCAGKIPWHYPGDLKFFKETTEGSTVIMGRKTWDSLPPKFRPLPNRRNIVLTKTSPESVQLEGLKKTDHFPSLITALGSVEDSKSDAWIIGGGEIYRLGLYRADQIVLTLVPEPDLHLGLREDPVYFPWIPPNVWRDRIQEHPHDTRLSVARYWRKTAP
jgi:dihydrofolate reductase